MKKIQQAFVQAILTDFEAAQYIHQQFLETIEKKSYDKKEASQQFFAASDSYLKATVTGVKEAYQHLSKLYSKELLSDLYSEAGVNGDHQGAQFYYLALWYEANQNTADAQCTFLKAAIRGNKRAKERVISSVLSLTEQVMIKEANYRDQIQALTAILKQAFSHNPDTMMHSYQKVALLMGDYWSERHAIGKALKFYVCAIGEGMHVSSEAIEKLQKLEQHWDEDTCWEMASYYVFNPSKAIDCYARLLHGRKRKEAQEKIDKFCWFDPVCQHKRGEIYEKEVDQEKALADYIEAAKGGHKPAFDAIARLQSYLKDHQRRDLLFLYKTLFKNDPAGFPHYAVLFESQPIEVRLQSIQQLERVRKTQIARIQQSGSSDIKEDDLEQCDPILTEMVALADYDCRSANSLAKVYQAAGCKDDPTLKFKELYPNLVPTWHFWNLYVPLLKNDPKYTVVDLSHPRTEEILKPEQATEVGKILNQNTHVKTLRLWRHLLSAEAGQAICLAVKDNRNITYFELEACCLMDANYNISDPAQSWSFGGISTVAAMLKENSTLTSFAFYGYWFNEKNGADAKIFCDALRQNRTLINLNLMSCCIRGEACRIFCELLRENSSSLKSLSLDQVGWYDLTENGEMLIQALAVNRTLTDFQLCSNYLHDEASARLYAILKNHPTIKTFYISPQYQQREEEKLKPIIVPVAKEEIIARTQQNNNNNNNSNSNNNESEDVPAPSLNDVYVPLRDELTNKIYPAVLPVVAVEDNKPVMSKEEESPIIPVPQVKQPVPVAEPPKEKPAPVQKMQVSNNNNEDFFGSFKKSIQQGLQRSQFKSAMLDAKAMINGGLFSEAVEILKPFLEIYDKDEELNRYYTMALKGKEFLTKVEVFLNENPDIQSKMLPNEALRFEMTPSESKQGSFFRMPVAAGSFGRIYAAGYYDYRKTPIKVAVKELIAFQEMTIELLKTVKNEISILAKLKSDYVIEFIGITLKDCKLSIVMPYADLGSLENVLTRKNENDEFNYELPWETRLGLLLQIAQGVAYLHANNVTHRDLKSANVLVFGNGNNPATWLLKLCDFGISKWRPQGTQTTRLPGVIAGTRAFMAPELLSCNYDAEVTVNNPCDVYSYGMMVAEVVFRKSPPHQISEVNIVLGQRPDLGSQKGCPPVIAAIAARCWEQKPKNRPKANDLVMVVGFFKGRVAAGYDLAKMEIPPDLQPKPGN